MLRPALDVVVVVVQGDGRIRLPGELERVDQVVRPYRLEPRRCPQVLGRRGCRVATVVDCFVDDVPSGDLALVAADQRVDVIPHPFQRHLTGGALEEPGIGLRVPDEGVTHWRDRMLLAEADERIGLGPVPAVLLRMHGAGLHRVFRRDRVELRRDHLQFGGVELVGPADVECGADQEGASIGVLHRRSGCLDPMRVEAAGSQRRGRCRKKRAT